MPEKQVQCDVRYGRFGFGLRYDDMHSVGRNGAFGFVVDGLNEIVHMGAESTRPFQGLGPDV